MHKNFPGVQNLSNLKSNRTSYRFIVSAKVDENKNKNKQSLFSSVTEALDFSQVRSVKDAELLQDAREATMSGGRMSRAQVKIQKLPFVTLIFYLQSSDNFTVKISFLVLCSMEL